MKPVDVNEQSVLRNQFVLVLSAHQLLYAVSAYTEGKLPLYKDAANSCIADVAPETVF